MIKVRTFWWFLVSFKSIFRSGSCKKFRIRADPDPDSIQPIVMLYYCSYWPDCDVSSPVSMAYLLCQFSDCTLSLRFLCRSPFDRLRDPDLFEKKEIAIFGTGSWPSILTGFGWSNVEIEYRYRVPIPGTVVPLTVPVNCRYGGIH
jgi:hypothetical protein